MMNPRANEMYMRCTRHKVRAVDFIIKIDFGGGAVAFSSL